MGILVGFLSKGMPGHDTAGTAVALYEPVNRLPALHNTCPPLAQKMFRGVRGSMYHCPEMKEEPFSGIRVPKLYPEYVRTVDSIMTIQLAESAPSIYADADLSGTLIMLALGRCGI